jgi:hypothetical protein
MSSKIVILEDCMSDVPGFSEQANPIYQDAKARGAQFQSSGYIIS